MDKDLKAITTRLAEIERLLARIILDLDETRRLLTAEVPERVTKTLVRG